MGKSPQLRFKKAYEYSRPDSEQKQVPLSSYRPFKHELNPRGGVDSICQRCSALVDSSKDEWSLLQSEDLHVCTSLRS
jgi:hypothetical protein